MQSFRINYSKFRSLVWLLVLISSLLVLGRAEAGLLHSTLHSKRSVSAPETAQFPLADKPLEIRATGAGVVRFENSGERSAVRLHGNLKNNELIWVNPAVIDFSRSGRLDFWIRFNSDPHLIKREFYIICDTAWPIQFQMEVLPYGNGQSNFAIWLGAQERGPEKQLYAATGDRYHPGGPWAKIKQGEWHRVTVTWWKHPGKNDELKLAIDGVSTEGMHDHTGQLPRAGEWNALHLGGNKFGDYAFDVSLSELWIFDDPDDTPERHSSR